MAERDNQAAEPLRYNAPQLLPRLGTLAVINLVVGVLALSPVAMVGLFFLPTGYLGIVILKTRDSIRDVPGLHPTDRWIGRWSGILAPALMAALFAGMCIVSEMDGEPGSSWMLLLVAFVMEVGVVLCVACLSAPRELRHVGPVVLWRIVAIPLLVIYGLYVVLILIMPFASRMTKH